MAAKGWSSSHTNIRAYKHYKSVK